MIRVAVLDDHPAVRLGLHAALASEPGLVPVGSATSAAELPSLLYRTDPDVVLLDHHLPDADGLSLCQGLKARDPGRRVILYSAFADGAMTVPAVVAGADGLVHKGARPQELFEAIRHVAARRLRAAARLARAARARRAARWTPTTSRSSRC